MTYNDYNDVRSRHVIQQLAVTGCNATTSPQLVEIQTPLFRFAVDIWSSPKLYLYD